ncbi:hypothetical protein [Hymenobacter rubripertinctus]|uniref:hypothetical protein n=1 Tax=Hymenobacter rubripertinctus TaxID=2029981 RepID=UPI00268C69C3
MEVYSKSMGGHSFRLTPDLMTFSGQVHTTVALESGVRNKSYKNAFNSLRQLIS